MKRFQATGPFLSLSLSLSLEDFSRILKCRSNGIELISPSRAERSPKSGRGLIERFVVHPETIINPWIVSPSQTIHLRSRETPKESRNNPVGRVSVPADTPCHNTEQSCICIAKVVISLAPIHEHKSMVDSWLISTNRSLPLGPRMRQKSEPRLVTSNAT